MNLAGNPSKNLFRSLRVGSRPSVVGLWAAATVVEQIRKDRRPKRERLRKKILEPGQSYLIRVPGPGEASLADAAPPGTVVADAGLEEESVASQLLSAASGLVQAATTTEAASPAEDDQSGSESLTGTLVEVAASFMGEDDVVAGEAPVELGRRRQKRQSRLASLEEVEIDRDALPRRRRRKLKRAERRARKRPSRKRVRRARRQQKKSLRAAARVQRRNQPSKRQVRKVSAAEQELAHRQDKLDKKSTRRRRRKARKAEKELARLSA